MQEAAVIKDIFDRYVNHGYGTHRICGYLADKGITTRNGSRFINTTIQNIIKRPLYIGIMRSGSVQSDVIPELQIISRDIFERAQEIAKERSAAYAGRHIPMNTKGNALLSGNVFCGHCNARLTLTTNGKKYVRKSDGAVTFTPKTRYVCYNKTRYPEKCNGQTGYTTSKLDGVIVKIVQEIFSKINEKPSEQIISAQFEERLAAVKLNLEQARAALESDIKTQSMLENEMVKIIQGTSVLKPEILNKKYEEVERSVAERKSLVNSLEQELTNSKDTMRQVTRQYNDVLSWAEMFANSDIGAKKMIVTQLISAVRVSRDYKIEIDFRISERQLGLEQAGEVVDSPALRKRLHGQEL